MKTAKINYKKLFSAYTKYSEYAIDWHSIDDKLAAEILAEYARASGKRTKNIAKAAKFLGDNRVEEIKKPYQELISHKIEQRRAIKENMKRMLLEYAENYEIKRAGKMILLRKSRGGDHHTQGFGANKYAKSELQADKLLLELSGFNVEIKEIVGDYVNRMRYNTYELWADITEFDFWMLKAKGKFISMLDWAVLCWRHGTNPKVYFPFISDIDYTESLKLSRDSNYVIKLKEKYP